MLEYIFLNPPYYLMENNYVPLIDIVIILQEFDILFKQKY